MSAAITGTLLITNSVTVLPLWTLMLHRKTKVPLTGLVNAPVLSLYPLPILVIT